MNYAGIYPFVYPFVPDSEYYEDKPIYSVALNILRNDRLITR